MVLARIRVPVVVPEATARSQYFDTWPLFLCAADKMRLHAAVKLLLCMASERQPALVKCSGCAQS